MALLYVDSFDHYAQADVEIDPCDKTWLVVGSPTFSFPANGRNSTNSLRLTNWGTTGAQGCRNFYGNVTTGILGFAFRFSGLPSSGTPKIALFSDGATEQVSLNINSSGILSVVSNSVELGNSGAFALVANTYYYIEIKVTIGNSGSFEVHVDKVQRINLSGVDTQVSANNIFTTFTLGDGTSADAGAQNIDYDDAYLCDNSGSVNNDFLGDCRVSYLKPTGAGASTQWTPNGAVNNYDCVDEASPNGTTDYIFSATAGQIDTYVTENLPFTSHGIFGVAVFMHGRKDGLNNVNIRAVSRPTSTNYFGASRGMTPFAAGDLRFYGGIFETNGDTSALWTESEVNAAEFGIDLLSNVAGQGAIITQIAVEVLATSEVVGNRITQYVVEAITQPSAAAGLPLLRITQYVVEAVLSTSTTVTPGEPCAPTSSIQQTYPPCYGAEFDTYIAPDGHTYDFHVKGLRHLMTEEGFGMPPISYLTSVGPYQHGQTVHDWFLEPRIIQLMISNSSNSRQAYTAARAALLDAIRPNRQVNDHEREPGVLRKRLSDGSLRDLKVLIESGPGFGPRDLARWDEYRFQEILRFIAHDPILFNPLQQCRSFLAIAGSPGSGGGTQLVFPCTFPITFGIGTGGGGSGGGLSGILQYNGTWEEYPQIVIHGPVVSPTIYNITTGEKLALEDEILEGETVTFDLTYATKTVTHSDGSNWLGRLSDDSDLATFHLSTINSGANIITITGSGTNAAMFVEFFYYERFIGR